MCIRDRPNASVQYDENKYQESKKKLMAKFDQLYNIGVRRFCLLNDDFGAGSPDLVVRLVNDLNKEYIKAKGCKPIIYCPQGYNVAWSQGASGQKELETLKQFDEDVLIFWTGQDVNSPFTQESINYAKEKTGHSPVFWVNYPCNEHAKSGIFLGSSAHYIRDNITGLAGAVSNPIHFAEADKVAFCLLYTSIMSPQAAAVEESILEGVASTVYYYVIGLIFCIVDFGAFPADIFSF